MRAIPCQATSFLKARNHPSEGSSHLCIAPASGKTLSTPAVNREVAYKIFRIVTIFSLDIGSKQYGERFLKINTVKIEGSSTDMVLERILW
jgi:hypothetical protein